MKYFVVKLTHDGGVSYLKTTATTVDKCIEQICAAEACPPSAVDIKETGKDLFSMESELLFKKLK